MRHDDIGRRRGEAGRHAAKRAEGGQARATRCSWPAGRRSRRRRAKPPRSSCRNGSMSSRVAIEKAATAKTIIATRATSRRRGRGAAIEQRVIHVVAEHIGQRQRAVRRRPPAPPPSPPRRPGPTSTNGNWLITGNASATLSRMEQHLGAAERRVELIGGHGNQASCDQERAPVRDLRQRNAQKLLQHLIFREGRIGRDGQHHESDEQRRPAEGFAHRRDARRRRRAGRSGPEAPPCPV